MVRQMPIFGSLLKSRYTAYPRVATAYRLSRKDRRLHERALQLASEHDSGGSYNMSALLSRSKPLGVGYNNLNAMAHQKNELYPELCGIHAELNLWTQFNREQMANSTVTVAGVISKSQNPMSSTLPCIYCSALLTSSNVRWIICMYQGSLLKTQPQSLVNVKGV